MSILFVCVHNAGRSQMAEALLNHLAARRGVDIHAVSAGTAVGERINPTVREVMNEVGVSLEGHQPKPLTPTMVAGADRIITMGCGVDAASCPTRFLVSEDWGLDDPAGQPVETVRTIRDQIQARVERLLDELTCKP